MTKWPYTKYVNVNPQVLNYFPFEKARKHQLETISEILEAVDNGYKYIVLEAGTGTGKSAIAATLSRMFESSYVLTITKQLQDQYVRDFNDFSVVKGRSNFKCRLSNAGCDEGKCVLEGHNCKYKIKEKVTGENTCSYYWQKYLALSSDVVISNYPYMFLELNYVGDFTKRSLMVCDEAHNIESMIMNQLKLEFSRQDLKEYIHFNLSKSRVNTLENGDFTTWMDFIEKIKQKYEIELEKISHLETKPDISRKILFIKNQNNACRRFISQIALSPDKWIFDYDRTAGVAQFKPLKIDSYAENTLFRYADVCLFMSATILDYELFATWLGISADEIYPIRCKSPFDVSHNLIKTYNQFNMTHDILKKSAPRTIPTIKSILSNHLNEKGIIHTISNECRDFLIDNINDSRLITHDTTNRAEVLEEFKKSTEALVLVSPSMNEGVDLPGDECRFQIIYKIPYPDLGDKQTQMRAMDNAKWMDYKTCLALVQTHGRGMRFEGDFCKTYMMDNRFMGYVYSDMISNQFLPDTFREAIDKIHNVGEFESISDSGTDQLISQGEQYIKNNDFEKAIAYFKNLLDKNDYRVYLKLAEIYEKTLLYEEEVKILTEFFKSGTFCDTQELELFKDKLKQLCEMGYFDYNSNIETLEKEFFKRVLIKY